MNNIDIFQAQLPPYFYYTPGFLSHAEEKFQQLLHELDRKLYPITMFGKTMMQPRLVAFYADVWVDYSYSQTHFYGSGWHPLLQEIKLAIINKYPQTISLNSVLCNLYRDWNDSMGRHSDNEPQLWDDPIIYSVTLGVSRNFQIKSKTTAQKYHLILEDNSLLMMWHKSQIDYLHWVPKTQKIIWPRINLTFRTIVS